MAKDKNKNDKKDKKDKKRKADGTVRAKPSKTSGSSSLKTLVQNPMVVDVVAAALVSMAAALRDSDKARGLATDAGDQLTALSKAGAKQGNAMWEMALTVGRSTIAALAAEATQPKSGQSKPGQSKSGQSKTGKTPK